MKFRGHAAEIKNKSEIPSLEKFIGMKVLHRVITCTVYYLSKKGEGKGRGLKRGETSSSPEKGGGGGGLKRTLITSTTPRGQKKIDKRHHVIQKI